MRVCLSRFTPGLANAEKVSLDIGEVVLGQSETSGERRRIRIDSDIREHTGELGWDCTYVDEFEQPVKWPGYPRCFVSAKSIVWWTGKVN